MKIISHLVDLHDRRIFPAEITIADGKISKITELKNALASGETNFMLPGFIDAHVHIESSMLPPSEFARLAVVHGTVATVSDPHEIANVLGVAGVEFMLHDARRVPLKFCFGAPSCVPATVFETAGAKLDADDVEKLLEKPEIGYLSEMMNFPGVLNSDPEILAKIKAAKRLGKPVDGHAPGLRGESARQYFAAGITTDHECFTFEEGLGKAKLGVKILIREGSAARNFDVLWPLLNEFPHQIMFCSDDKHPDDLVRGHINHLVARAISNGCDLFDTLRAACLNPVGHYNLKVGLLRIGDPADFILVENLTDFRVLETWIDGKKVAENGRSLLPRLTCDAPNKFLAKTRLPSNFHLFPKRKTSAVSQKVNVIRVFDGQIISGKETGLVKISADGRLLADPENDLIFIAVLNRYALEKPVALGFVRGFGLKNGALASSVAHDSHNIVAVGVDENAICAAVNAVIQARGGISASDGSRAESNDGFGKTEILPLPIAGLMSLSDGYSLAADYSKLDFFAKNRLGCVLSAPFMSLSFLALPVIPALKMTDLGLFDAEKFEFLEVEENYL